MKIAVAGAGYVGLSLGVLLAQHNHVRILDIQQEKADLINNKKSPIRDKEIEKFLATKSLNLFATTDYHEAFKGAEYIIVATPTNYDDDKNSFDTSSVDLTIDRAIEVAPNATIVVKSTIPVGYIKNIRKQKRLSDNVFFSPEFLREGKALYDNLYPSRIIVGAHTKKAEEFAELLAAGAIKKDVPILFTGATEAEAIKLFANTYLALRIAYFNELDTYAETEGLDTKEIIKGICLDPRIGDHYNNPSFGYGGYCLPKDSKQLLANYASIPQELIKAVVQANKVRKEYIKNEVLKKKAKRIGIYRLTMKKDSDNFRASAIQDIINQLKKSDEDILIYEPTLNDQPFNGTPTTSDFRHFEKACDLIVANRIDNNIKNTKTKVYTRDLFDRD